MIDDELKDVLTIIGRVLYVMGKKGITKSTIAELRKDVGTGVYQLIISGVKKGWWHYDYNTDTIELTEKGVRMSRRLSKL